MRMGVHSGSKLISRANLARADAGLASPYDLWLLADREAAGVDSKRRELYRHALIHAGYLLSIHEKPYVICPICYEQLT